MRFVTCALAGGAPGVIAGYLTDSGMVAFVASFAATYGLCEATA